MKKQHDEWFERAEIDRISAKALLNNKDGHPNTVCFLAQQIAEKYLKGLLIYHNGQFRKVHDLLELETILLKLVPEINSLHDDLTFLNGFYIETRYPGDFPDFSWKDAEEAFAKAIKVKNFIITKTKTN